MVNLGRTYSPNAIPPYYADLPARYIGDSMIVDRHVIKKWESNFPTLMIEEHFEALKSLTAFKMDWGRNDIGRHTPFSCLEFSKKLERFGVNHFAEEYLGGHDDKIAGIVGRF